MEWTRGNSNEINRADRFNKTPSATYSGTTKIEFKVIVL